MIANAGTKVHIMAQGTYKNSIGVISCSEESRRIFRGVQGERRLIGTVGRGGGAGRSAMTAAAAGLAAGRKERNARASNTVVYKSCTIVSHLIVGSWAISALTDRSYS